MIARTGGRAARPPAAGSLGPPGRQPYVILAKPPAIDGWQDALRHHRLQVRERVMGIAGERTAIGRCRRGEVAEGLTRESELCQRVGVAGHVRDDAPGEVAGGGRMRGRSREARGMVEQITVANLEAGGSPKAQIGVVVAAAGVSREAKGMVGRRLIG